MKMQKGFEFVYQSGDGRKSMFIGNDLLLPAVAEANREVGNLSDCLISVKPVNRPIED